jgi:hypothetical protein
MGAKKYTEVSCKDCGNKWMKREDGIKEWGGRCKSCYYKTISATVLARSKKEIIQKDCNYCGKSFIFNKCRTKGHCCSSICFNKSRIGHTSNKGKRIPSMTGENNPMWKGGVSYAIRGIRKGQDTLNWKKDLLVIYDYTCQKCGIRGGKLHAHHIQNFSSHPELRTDINNGIIFCVDHHKEFHKIYSKSGNNRQQVDEYINRQVSSSKKTIDDIISLAVHTFNTKYGNCR